MAEKYRKRLPFPQMVGLEAYDQGYNNRVYVGGYIVYENTYFQYLCIDLATGEEYEQTRDYVRQLL